MVVAVNLNAFPDGISASEGAFFITVFEKIAKRNPENQFVVINKNGINEFLSGCSNVKQLVAGPASKGLLFWRYWYTIKLPAILKKEKVAVLFSADSLISPALSLPQCITGSGIGFVQHPGLLNKRYSGFYKRSLSNSMLKAGYIIVVNDKTKNEIISRYKTDAEKIKVIAPLSATSEISLSVEQKEQVKNEYTGGKEYFINTSRLDEVANIMSLLKGFSLFKKRQQTNMKLVLAGEPGEDSAALRKALETYKYREDVVLTASLHKEELQQLVAASYALVDTSLFQHFETTIGDAMRWGVPVITSFTSPEIPVLELNPEDITDIAAQLMLLYKDEALRNEMIEKGIQMATSYNMDTVAELIWDCIQSAAAAK